MAGGKASIHWPLSTTHVLSGSLDGNDPYILIVPCPLHPTRDSCYQIVYKIVLDDEEKVKKERGEEEKEKRNRRG